MSALSKVVHSSSLSHLAGGSPSYCLTEISPALLCQSPLVWWLKICRNTVTWNMTIISGDLIRVGHLGTAPGCSKSDPGSTGWLEDREAKVPAKRSLSSKGSLWETSGKNSLGKKSLDLPQGHTPSRDAAAQGLSSWLRAAELRPRIHPRGQGGSHFLRSRAWSTCLSRLLNKSNL